VRSYLGEALRALLVVEARTARVVAMHAPDKRPAYLPAGCEAVRASLRTASGARICVIMGAPPDGDRPSSLSVTPPLPAHVTRLAR
jgi:hypothetical protein